MNLKNIAIFLSGAITGATLIYIYMKKTEQKEIVWEVKEETPEGKKEFINKPSYQDKFPERKNKIDYEDYYSAEAAEIDSKLAAGMSMKEIKDEKQLTPFIISEDDYINTCETYQKVCLTYFSKNDILVEDGADQDPLNIDETIGYDKISMFGMDQFLPVNILFVRNDYLEIDYEVCKDDNLDYETDVLIGGGSDDL